MNVVGLVPGADPALAGEAITVGAHFDHLNPAGGRIRNGADDKASGSAGVLEIAEAVASRLLRRPVLFFEKARRLSQLIHEVTAELGNRDASIRPAAAQKPPS